MTPDLAFTLLTNFSMLGWISIAVGIIFRLPWLRDGVGGIAVPLVLSLAYTLIVALHIVGAEGGFGSLAGVKALFRSDWLLLAGWVHYLAFDLFVGAWIARQTVTLGLNRLILIPLLPLTLMFGPAGFAAFVAARAIASRSATVQLAD